ncbi:MAG TPA: hypothetical protein DEQ43_21720 [Nocardioides bacterium]|uniref:hypothetical protein n=1 Tax=uncultured Nocardioides sp. TaxID=198441 RepID=UPI000EE74D9D|nr:hypothetical protein [uncultured Nocardioides sp.]HCB06826.1 hypothetical protein [Nocardioides sp.]HRD63566.1 hypothetical protein [Nocardioides sp.]HRK47999.1 hypothetical protein [Nocardioides sp.]
MTITTGSAPATTHSALEQRLLTASLIAAPVTYLAADTTYAARGWDDATAGALAVVASILYGFVALRVATWLPPGSLLRIAVVIAGLIGSAGAVAYGFDSIHLSLGDTQLVDRSGAANLIKPLGLFFPLALVLMGAAIIRLGSRAAGALVLVAGVLWPVAHIANVETLAVAVNVLLVLGFGSLAWRTPTPGSMSQGSPSSMHST